MIEEENNNRIFKVTINKDYQQNNENSLKKEIKHIEYKEIMKVDVNNKYSLNPIIFCKSRDSTIIEKDIISNPVLVAFENYLAIVVQLYYNQNFDIKANVINILKDDDNKKSKKGNYKKNAKNNSSSYPNNNILLDNDNLIENSYNKNDNNFLGMLLSPFKKTYVFEKWTLKEIAIFESFICYFGKDFKKMHLFIPSKIYEEIIEFFNFWKLSSHYKIWKIYKNKLKAKYNPIWC